MQAAHHSLYTPRWLALAQLATRTLRRLVRAWRDRRRAAAAHAALAALNDRTLRDLGLHRSEIESLSRFPSDPDRARVIRSTFGSHV